ncbi:MAG: type IV toxin-antitoxin system AbiEi family antitoxin domain-containing protein [Pseudohongiellaceae bacterium]
MNMGYSIGGLLRGSVPDGCWQRGILLHIVLTQIYVRLLNKNRAVCKGHEQNKNYIKIHKNPIFCSFNVFLGSAISIFMICLKNVTNLCFDIVMAETPSKRQKSLAALLRATPGTIRVADATRALEIDRQHASRLLAGWHKQGVVRRVAHGLYVPVQPSALGQTQVLEDPWVLVPELYRPGYIGGWSALEYWGLTEQIFRSICVLTHKRVTYGGTAHQGVDFFIKYVPEKNLFGTKTLWRETTKVQVSDPYKTLLDCIDDLHLGAGLQHITDCLLEFIKVFNKPSDLDTLLNYAIQINNGALFKKLGYLAEMLEFESSFVGECRKHLTSGYATLDKNAKSNRLVTRWNLWVPGGKPDD